MAFVVAAVLVVTHSGADGQATAFYGQFATGLLPQFAKLLILLGAALAVWMSIGYMRAYGGDRFEFPILVLFATIGMLIMVSANDLIALYMGIELQSLALYVIASIRRDSLKSTEAGLKYFVLGAVSSGMLLYGCSLIYGFAGSTQFQALAEVLGKGELPTTPDSHMIMLSFDNGVSVTLRTSGTEPKIKFYTELAGGAGQSAAAVKATLTAFVDEVVEDLLQPPAEAGGLRRHEHTASV